eukprot:TRINITY_DN44012_c0_g1_i1.p1 TRINITY_DN44012_c0_g1~~TRINITY_DN44012_c0_g1_i1.p1  ORF type:complete len:307 (+),score=59.17 TRINITY_DN44012_c0_g1_i1:69-989(+)
MDTQIHNLVNQTFLGNLVFSSHKLITADATTTSVGEILALLNDNNIMSVPLVLEEVKSGAHSSTTDVIQGILSIHDIILHLANSGATEYNFDNKPAAEVLGNSYDSTSIITEHPTTTVRTAINHLSKANHRLLVRTGTKGRTELRMLTQSDLVRFIASHSQVLSPLMAMPLKDTGIDIVKAMASVKVNETALDAFKLMAKFRCSSVPVVNDEGTILTTISASDLRSLTSLTGSPALSLTVLDYLKYLNYNGVTPPATCTLNTPFSLVIATAALCRIHRLWVVDDIMRPIGVVSLTAILKYFNAKLD